MKSKKLNEPNTENQYGLKKSSVIPEPLAPEFEIDNNRELFKETLLVMRVKLGSD